MSQMQHSMKATNIRLEGYIDAETSIDFEKTLSKMLEDEKFFIILDCQDLKYISDAGIGALISLSEKFDENEGKLIFYKLSPEIQNLMDFLNLQKSIYIAHTREVALRQLGEFAQALSIEEVVEPIQEHRPEIVFQPDRTEEVLPELKISSEEEIEIPEKNAPQSRQVPLGIARSKVTDSPEKVSDSGDNEEMVDFQDIVSDEIPFPDFHDEVNVPKEIKEKLSTDAEMREIVTEIFQEKPEEVQVITCPECAKLSKVRQAGKYSCPHCGQKFEYTADKTILMIA